MKITFEDEGASIVVDLPNTTPRANRRALSDFGCRPLDAEVDLIVDTYNDMDIILNNKIKADKEGNMVPLLRLIAMYISKIDPGAPIDFWDLLYKLKKL